MTDPMTREQIEALDGHTPGPWAVHGENTWNLAVGTEPLTRVCFMAHSGGLNDERDLANARLIAAAPDLRTTCLALMDEVERLTPIATTDRLPEKPGLRSYEYVRCLIFVDGEWEIGMWNCEHLCWDDDEGDDFRYDPLKPTHWMPLPPAPALQEQKP